MDRKILFAELVKQGWITKEGALHAPRGTMWLDESVPWGLDWRQFRERMQSRKARLLASQDIDSEAYAASVSDVSTLLIVLDELLHKS